MGWVGDTSTSYGIGVIVGQRWARFHLQKNPPEHRTGNIVAWLETVAARLCLLLMLSIGAAPGKTFIVKTDNNTTLSKILHCKSKDGGVKAKWKIIKNLLLQAGIVSLRDNTVAQKASTVPYSNPLQFKLHFHILHVLQLCSIIPLKSGIIL
jgi:hypothetical protein